MPEPSPGELWKQASGDGKRYRELMIEHGHLVLLAPGEKAEPLPCGWPATAGREVTANDQPAQVSPRRFATRQCPACLVPIIWATRDSRDRTKRWVMLDVEPVTPGPCPAPPGKARVDPADVLLTDLGPRFYPRARVVTNQAELFGQQAVYQRHLRTCARRDLLLERLARRRAREVS